MLPKQPLINAQKQNSKEANINRGIGNVGRSNSTTHTSSTAPCPSPEHHLEVFQLMGVEMPPVRRRCYAGNYPLRATSSQNSISVTPHHQSARQSSSAGSLPHQRVELSLIGDDSSDSGVSSRSPTPNYLLSAGAAGDQGLPDDAYSKTMKETKQTNSNNRMNSHHQGPFYHQNQHNRHHNSGYHHNQSQRSIRNQSPHRSNFSSSNVTTNNSNNTGGHVSSSTSNTSNNSSGNNNSGNNGLRRFHSGRHGNLQSSSATARRRGNTVVQIHPPPNSMNTPLPPPTLSLMNNHCMAPMVYSGSTPPDRFLSKSHLVQVTKTPPHLTNGSPWDELSKAVWNKFLTNQQTEETYRKKLSLWKYLYLYIKMIFPRYGLFLVGSTMSGFGSNTSDVDMCLLVRRQDMDQRSEALLHLTNILSHLHLLDNIEKVDLIQAKVPILKFRERTQGLDVDLNCNSAVGIRNTHLLSCYAKADWRVRPLVLVVKLWAQWHDINDAKNMTISSYSLALMVIHFLQCGINPPVLPCFHLLYQSKFSPYSDISSIDIHEELPPFHSENKQSLGELLLQFFSYYDTFDYSTNAVSVRLACRLPIDDCRRARTIKNEPHQWKYLCIEEPFDQTNTARSVYDLDAFERIRNIIHATYCNLNATHSLDAIFRLESKNSQHHGHPHSNRHINQHHSIHTLHQASWIPPQSIHVHPQQGL